MDIHFLFFNVCVCVCVCVCVFVCLFVCLFCFLFVCCCFFFGGGGGGGVAVDLLLVSQHAWFMQMLIYFISFLFMHVPFCF